jgi:hypothetical protein
VAGVWTSPDDSGSALATCFRVDCAEPERPKSFDARLPLISDGANEKVERRGGDGRRTLRRGELDAVAGSADARPDGGAGAWSSSPSFRRACCRDRPPLRVGDGRRDRVVGATSFCSRAADEAGCSDSFSGGDDDDDFDTTVRIDELREAVGNWCLGGDSCDSLTMADCASFRLGDRLRRDSGREATASECSR